MLTETFPSSSTDAIYTTTIDPATGDTTCSCPGWTKRVTAGVRSCKHTKEMAQKHLNKRVAAIASECPPEVKAAIRKVGEQSAALAIKPMLASAMVKGFSLDDFIGNPNWLLEEKYDGWRTIIRKAGDTVTAFSRPRSGHEAIERTLPKPVFEACLQLPDGLFDGELVTPGGRSWDVARLDTRASQVLVLFDVIEVFGQLVTSKPYAERRSLLTVAVAHHAEHTDSVRIIVPASVPVSLEALGEIWGRGGEGAILKRYGSTYQPGRRSADWLKVKKQGAATLTITGFEAGKTGPYAKVALRTDDGKTTTVKTKDNATMEAFAADPDSFIGRRLVISYCELTDGGSFRHGIFDHFAGPHE